MFIKHYGLKHLGPYHTLPNDSEHSTLFRAKHWDQHMLSYIGYKLWNKLSFNQQCGSKKSLNNEI